MSKTAIFILLAIVLFVGSWTVLSMKSQFPADDQTSGMSEAVVPEGEGVDQLTRSDSGEGGVTVSATYVTDSILAAAPSMPTPQYNPDTEIVFLIAMNTHSGDLLGYDLTELTILTDDAGNELKPIGDWEVVSNGGHHRSGYLRFSRDDDIELSNRAGSLELTVKDIAEIPERRLTWKLPLPNN